jgi:hypothetical protein
MEPTVSMIDKRVERLEARAQAARQLQSIIREFPELLKEILDADSTAELPVVVSLPAPQRTILATVTRAKKSAARPTAFQRVASVFLNNENDWVDTSTLVQRSGVSRNVAATVLWSAHREQFEQRPHQTHKRMKLWRLTPEAYDNLMDQQRLFIGSGKEED